MDKVNSFSLLGENVCVPACARVHTRTHTHALHFHASTQAVHLSPLSSLAVYDSQRCITLVIYCLEKLSLFSGKIEFSSSVVLMVMLGVHTLKLDRMDFKDFLINLSSM